MLCYDKRLVIYFYYFKNRVFFSLVFFFSAQWFFFQHTVSQPSKLCLQIFSQHIFEKQNETIVKVA